MHRSYRDAQITILREVRRIAFKQSLHQPVLAFNPIGLNNASPLEKTGARLTLPVWTCKEHTDRWEFLHSRLRTLQLSEDGEIAGLKLMTFLDESEWVLVPPRNARLAFKNTSRQVAVSVEIMKRSQAHPFAYARVPEVGPVDDFALANTVAIRIAGRDSLNVLRGFYCQAVMPETPARLEIRGTVVELTQGYVYAMMLRATLLKTPYEYSVDESLQGRPSTVWELRHDVLAHETNLVFWEKDTKDFLSEPEIVSVADNRKFLETEYGLNFTPPEKHRDCDMCSLYRQFWRAEARQTNQSAKSAEPCVVEGGVSRKWKGLHIPASWTAEHQLRTALSELFFKKLAKQADDILPEDAESFSVQLDNYTEDPTENKPEGDKFGDVGDVLKEDGLELALFEEGEFEGFDPEDDDVSESEDAEDQDDEGNSQQPSRSGDTAAVDNNGAVTMGAEDITPASQNKIDKAKFVDATSKDTILGILRSKNEGGKKLFLVVLNNLGNDAVWVDILRFDHQKDIIREYWNISKNEDVPDYMRTSDEVGEEGMATADVEDNE